MNSGCQNRKVQRSNTELLAGVDVETSALVKFMDRLIARDDAAWSKLLGIISPIVGSRCRNADLNADETEDVAQAVVLKLLENNSRVLRKLEIISEESFYGWLKVIVSRTVLDYIRGAKTLHEKEFYSGKTEWKKTFESCPQNKIESMIFVEQTIQELSGDEQALFWLDFRGLKGREIAGLLGLPLNTVQVKLSRLRKKLRKILKLE